jgi:hypothetical protein
MAKVLHASYSGYFPYCILPYQESVFFPFVSRASLTQAMSLFWRVKKMRISGTYQTPPPNQETRSWEMIAESAANDESKLVCNPGIVITSTQNIVSQPAPPAFGFTDYVQSSGGLFVCPFTIAGFFADTQEEGFSYTNPAQSGTKTLSIEGTTLTGEDAGTGTQLQVLEYWQYNP